MSTFTLAISYLTTSSLPWFMDLTFQVPMQYCSLHHQTLLLSQVTSTTGCCFCFGSIPSFFPELFLHWSPVVCWAPTDLGSSSFSILSFSLFVLFMGFSRQECSSGLPFPSPVDHILSDLFTMTRLSWVAPRAWLSFIELDKAVVLVWLDWLVFCEYGFSVSALWCPVATPTILLAFLFPWEWDISSRLLQQGPATAPYIGRGVSPYHCPSWPSTWDSSSRPSCACTATAPQVAPPSHRPWPPAWLAYPSCCPDYNCLLACLFLHWTVTSFRWIHVFFIFILCPVCQLSAWLMVIS